jgi:hypothetical protein
MPNWINLIFCIIWTITSIVFFCLAYDSYQSSKITLAKFSVENSEGINLRIGNFDAVKTLNNMAEINNNNVSRLEKSIHDTASLTFWLNIISAFSALMGLFAQYFIRS